MACKHHNEWAYGGSHLSSLTTKVEEVLNKGIEQEENEAKKQELETLKQERMEAFKARVEQLAIWENIELRESSYLTKVIEGSLLTNPVTSGPYIAYKAGKWLLKKAFNGDKPEEEIPLSPFPIEQPVVHHFHPVAFVEQMKRIDYLKDIDLSDPDKWMSQFDNPINPSQACYRTSVIVLQNYGVECGGLGTKLNEKYSNGTNKWSNVIQMVVQNENGSLHNTGREKEVMDYINEQLEKGNPVLAGVDKESYKTYNKDNSTEHFFVITGRLTDSQGKIYYRFYEVGTHSENKDIKGINPLNRLYFDGNKRLTGKPSYSNVKLTVTQIRKNR